MITEQQTKDCSNALIEWFKSQDCDPADGALVMLRLLAKQLVAKTTDIAELEAGCRHAHLILVLNVMTSLKANV